MDMPCISQHVEVYFEREGSITVYNRMTGKTYSIGRKEYDILKNLDGTKTSEELSLISKSYSVDEIDSLISKFETIGFIRNKEIKSKINILKIKKGLINANKWINPNHIIPKILAFIIIYLSIPLFLVGLYLGYKNINLIYKILENSITSPSIIILIPTTLFVLSLHELGHAIVARNKGVNVPDIGIMLYWFMPCAYTNLTGITFIQSKAVKLLIFFSGMFVNMGLSGIALILLQFTSGKLYDFLIWFAVSNLSIILVNLLIFLKLDGYFILQELLCEKKLREKSFKYIKDGIMSFYNRKSRIGKKRLLYHGEFLNYAGKSDLNNSVYWLYGVLSILYIPIILLVTVSTIISFLG